MNHGVARIDWRRVAVQALLLTTMQIVAFNFGYLSYMSEGGAGRGPIAVAVMIATGFVMSLPLAASAQWVEGRWPWPAITALVIAECTLTILQRDLNVVVQGMVGIRRDPAVSPYPTFAWVAFAGGIPFFAYCLVAQRAVRVRGLLARAEFERARTTTLLGQAEVDALEGRVDPAMLQRSLEALQSAYASDRARAEALLDALVDFLRQAMPALRSGRSTLLDELTLLRRYATLVNLVERGRRLCGVSFGAPAHNPVFAPLLLIPLVEALARANRAAAPPCIVLTVGPSALRLDFEAQVASDWLDKSLAQRLARALCGPPEAAKARWEVGGARPLTLWLPLPPASEECRYEERLQPA
jgi:hypothetical protein